MFVFSVILQAPASGLDTQSMVSIGVLIVVVGAAIRVTSLLSRIDARLEGALEKLAILAPVPGALAVLVQRVDRAEIDIEELWGKHRGDGDHRRP